MDGGQRLGVAEDQVAFVAALNRVAAGAADQDVLAAAAVNDVVAGVLHVLADNFSRSQCGLQFLRQRRQRLGRVARPGYVLNDPAQGAEDHVVVIAVGIGLRILAGSLAVDEVVAGLEWVVVRVAAGVGGDDLFELGLDICTDRLS